MWRSPVVVITKIGQEIWTLRDEISLNPQVLNDCD